MVPLGLMVWHNAWAAMLGYHLAMALVLWFDRRHFRPAGLRPFRRLWIPTLAIACGAAGSILLLLAWPFLDIPDSAVDYLASVGIQAQTWPFFLAYFALINPWLEELFWRGYLDSPAVHPVLNDMLFAGYHLLVLVVWFPPLWLVAVFLVLTAAAWLWRQANRLSGGRLTSILSHQIADFSIMLVVFLLLFK